MNKVQEKLFKFYKMVETKYDSNALNSILQQSPFVEEEHDLHYSSLHDLIDEGWLKFISMDIREMNTVKYTVRFSSKAIQEIERIMNQQ